MKKLLLLLTTLFVCLVLVRAQNVGINSDGSTPDVSAMLDIKSTNKGVLIPRIALTGSNDVTTIPNLTSAQSALLIFNTATAGSGTTAVIPGYYYWSGTEWTRFTSSTNISSSAWVLGGNAGTSPSTNFIGTTDNQPLLFKTNNQFAGMLSSRSISFGLNTLNVSSTGNDNIGMGPHSLSENTTGNSNTALGGGALSHNKTGETNIAIGNSSLRDNTAGSHNIAMGSAALLNNQSNYNIGIGENALFNNNEGHNNVALGHLALQNNNGGVWNVGMGTYALTANIGGNDNIAIGPYTLGSNQSGNDNTAIGSHADVGTGNLSNATAIGAHAIVNASNTVQIGNSAVTDVYFGNENTTVLHGVFPGGWSTNGNTGTDASINFIGTTDDQPLIFKVNNIMSGKIGHLKNTYLGVGSGVAGSAGDFNTSLGYMALHSVTGGSENVAIGSGASYANENGSNNISIGHDALYQNTNGFNNIAIGRNTLWSNQSNWNIAMGDNTLTNNSTGENNVALGHTALAANTTGVMNVGVGTNSLRNNQGGFANAAIGDRSLYSNNSGHGVTGLGFLADVGSADLYNATAIGANSRVDCSNCLVLGAINGINGSDNNTRVGIGTTSPDAQFLSVGKGSMGNITGGNKPVLAVTGDDNFNAEDGGMLAVVNTGTWGIDKGASILFGGVYDDASNMASFARINSKKETISGGYYNGYLSFETRAYEHNLEERMRITSEGRIGIGTTNPDASAALELNSSNKGFLIPRMTQTERDAISAPATGLQVYQTDNTPGFYYYNGTAWTSVAGNVNTSNLWTTNGNAGTNPSTNFIGTTDNTPLSIKVNNENSGLIDAAKQNTAFGNKALSNNTGGIINSAFGKGALELNTSGYYNTAIGHDALKSNNGAQNTAVGDAALYSNISGNVNIAVGMNALWGNKYGSENVAMGYGAAASLVQGYDNIAFGAAALSNLKTGSYNIGIGTFAGPASDGLNNTIAIGHEAKAGASNTVQIGNSEVTDVYFGTPSSTILHANSVTPSDARFKYSIKNDVPGLDFITKLSPVTYYFDEQKLDEYTKTGILNNSNIIPASYNGEKQLHTGFLAQDVEKIAEDLGYNFDGVHKPGNKNGHYSLSYGQFVVPLVKAVQEQQVQIEQLKKENEELRKLKAQVESLSKTVEALSTHK